MVSIRCTGACQFLLSLYVNDMIITSDIIDSLKRDFVLHFPMKLGLAALLFGC